MYIYRHLWKWIILVPNHINCSINYKYVYVIVFSAPPGGDYEELESDDYDVDATDLLSALATAGEPPHGDTRDADPPAGAEVQVHFPDYPGTGSTSTVASSTARLPSIAYILSSAPADSTVRTDTAGTYFTKKFLKNNVHFLAEVI